MSWKRIDSKTVWVEAGTPLPFFCPVCGKLSEPSEQEVITCDFCDFTGSDEDFKGVEFSRTIVH